MVCRVSRCRQNYKNNDVYLKEKTMSQIILDIAPNSHKNSIYDIKQMID
ncbi:hypothetical protein LCGC14_2005960, partial [marine sediment metagenome]